MNIRTTSGENFSREEHAQMAALVYKRFGWDLAAAAAAWRRLLGNSCPDSEFADLAGYATTAVRRRFR
jgi:hypothetical protein